MVPVCSSRWSRSATAGDDSPTRRPSSASDSRASCWSSPSRRRFVESSGPFVAIWRSIPLTIHVPATDRRRSCGDGRARASPPLLRRQRRLPLPRARLRSAAVRPRGRARRGLAAHSLRRAGVRALAPSLAAVREARPAGPAPAGGMGRGARGDERLLLRRDRPPATRHGRCHRVPPRDRPGRARRAQPAQRRRAGAGRAGRVPPHRRAARGEPLGVALSFANALLFAAYIVLAHRVARHGALSGIDGLAASMLIAAVVVTPIGGWQVLPALTDPVALLAGIGVGLCSSVIPYVSDQLAMRRLPRATYALMVSLLPATATVIGIAVLAQIPSWVEVAGVALVIAGVAIHRQAPEPRTQSAPAERAAPPARASAHAAAGGPHS